MDIYDNVIRKFRNYIEHNVTILRSKDDSFCDISYKGHIVMRVTDCDLFCVLESPILLTREPHGHTLVLMSVDDSLIRSISSNIDTGIRRLVVLFRVLKDRFPYYRVDKNFYFKIENVFLILKLDFSEWGFQAVIGSNSTYSYLRVVSDLCKDLNYCTGHKMGFNTNRGLYSEISDSFKLRA